MSKEVIKGCIYLLRNLVNGKGYAGQHKNVETVERTRWAAHIREAFVKKSPHPLYRAMRKYGIENFSAEVIWTGHPSEVNAKETHHIKKCDTFIHGGWGYNQTLGGEGNRGYKVKPVTIKKLRRSQKLRFTKTEEREKSSAGQLRRFSDPEELLKNSLAQKNFYKENPSARKRRAKLMRKLHADPVQSLVYIESQKRPATSQKKSDAMSARFSDPAKLADHRAALRTPAARSNASKAAKLAWAKRKASAQGEK